MNPEDMNTMNIVLFTAVGALCVPAVSHVRLPQFRGVGASGVN